MLNLGEIASGAGAIIMPGKEGGQAGGLRVANVQDLSQVAGHSVSGWTTSNYTQTVEEVPEGCGVFITDSDGIYNAAAQQKYFRWEMTDTVTAKCEVFWTWDCNLCGSHTFYAQLLTLARKPKKLHFATANAFPITVPEFDPKKTIILRACGTHKAMPHLSDEVTLSSLAGLTGVGAYQLGYYLIEP